MKFIFELICKINNENPKNILNEASYKIFKPFLSDSPINRKTFNIYFFLMSIIAYVSWKVGFYLSFTFNGFLFYIGILILILSLLTLINIFQLMSNRLIDTRVSKAMKIVLYLIAIPLLIAGICIIPSFFSIGFKIFLTKLEPLIYLSLALLFFIGILRCMTANSEQK